MSSTRVACHIRAPRASVYGALLDPEAVRHWMVPNGMTSEIHSFDAITYLLADADGGTDLVGVHENLPSGVRPADNELGWRMSLDKLAALLEDAR